MWIKGDVLPWRLLCFSSPGGSTRSWHPARQARDQLRPPYWHRGVRASHRSYGPCRKSRSVNAQQLRHRVHCFCQSIWNIPLGCSVCDMYVNNNFELSFYEGQCWRLLQSSSKTRPCYMSVLAFYLQKTNDWFELSCLAHPLAMRMLWNRHILVNLCHFCVTIIWLWLVSMVTQY